MTPFEYILALLAVLVGLAIAHVATAVHRLLRLGARVRWAWRPIGAAFLAVLTLLEVWWVFYASRDADHFTSLGGFLALAAQVFLLFLLNAAALPDDVPREGLDLGAFYDDNAPYFWRLYAAYIGFTLAVRVGQIAQGAESAGGGLLALLPGVLLLAFFLALARFRHRVFHSVAVTLLVVLFLAQWTGLRLGGA